MKRCVGAIEEFEFLPMSSGKHLHVSIAVTGWLCSGKYSESRRRESSSRLCSEENPLDSTFQGKRQRMEQSTEGREDRTTTSTTSSFMVLQVKS